MCFAIFLSSCSIEIEDLEETDIYSRDYIMSIDQSLSMGFGKTDDETIALQYIYSNDGDCIRISIIFLSKEQPVLAVLFLSSMNSKD